MAMRVEPIDVGVDVGKKSLTIAQDNQNVVEIPNDAESIRAWLKTLGRPARIGVEATNIFHVELVERAHRAGHTVYVVDGYRLNRYRESIGGRAKTDAGDARLMLRYLKREASDLRPWSPPPKGYRDLQQLILRRGRLVQCKTRLAQSLGGLTQLGPTRRALIRHIDQVDAILKKRIRKVLQNHQWLHEARRIQAVEGIGEITAAALVMTFQRGAFANSDAFIAFLGLDVRVRDSGTLRGRRKLTKKGAAELRRLLYMAAMTARRSETWKAFYQRHCDRGLSKIQALVVLARKLARVAFALLKNKSEYRPEMRQEGCIAT